MGLGADSLGLLKQDGNPFGHGFVQPAIFDFNSANLSYLFTDA